MNEDDEDGLEGMSNEEVAALVRQKPDPAPKAVQDEWKKTADKHEAELRKGFDKHCESISESSRN
jgi:hypothetical protein